MAKCGTTSCPVSPASTIVLQPQANASASYLVVPDLLVRGFRINRPWKWSSPEARALIKSDTARADPFSETGIPPSAIELIASPPHGGLLAGITLMLSSPMVARPQKPVR